MGLCRRRIRERLVLLCLTQCIGSRPGSGPPARSLALLRRRRSGGDAGAPECRDARRERVVPLRQPLVALAPFAAEAQVLVAERTGERDLPDIRNGGERRRVRL